MDTMASRITELLRKRGMRQRELAEAIGLDSNKLTKSLNGTRELRVGETAAISDALGVDMLWLASGTPDPRATKVAMRHTYDEQTGRYVPPDGDELAGIALVERAYRLADDHDHAEDADRLFQAFHAAVAPAEDPSWADVRAAAAQVSSIWGTWRAKHPADGLRDLCEGFLASVGVDLVVLPAVSSPRAQTCALEISGHRVVIVNTSRAWHSAVYGIFHELGHLLHGHVEVPTGEDPDDRTLSDEQVANAFAADTLFPYRDVVALPDGAEQSVLAEACWSHLVGAATAQIRLHAAHKQVEVPAQASITRLWEQTHAEAQRHRAEAFSTQHFPEWLVACHGELVSAGTVRPATLAEMLLVPAEDLPQPASLSLSPEVTQVLDSLGL